MVAEATGRLTLYTEIERTGRYYQQKRLFANKQKYNGRYLKDMIAQSQLKKPTCWQDFELLCKKLWGEIWDCSDSIKRNGRQGQNQHGVDVYALPKGETAYYGIQCKGKDEYTNAQLTKEEIDAEIEKARGFEPPLKRLIFATTANKDEKIEEYIRIKNIDNRAKGLFDVDIVSWEDIVDLLEERKATYKWYVNNCQYKDSSDVSISFALGNTECVIRPKYLRTTTKYVLRKRELEEPFNIFNQQIRALSVTPTLSLSQFFERKINYCWGKIFWTISNIGQTVLEDYKLYLTFDKDAINELDTPDQYENNPLIDAATRAAINGNIDRNREVFFSKDYSNVLVFKPLANALVQEDHVSFKTYVKPLNHLTPCIKVYWKFVSRDYSKDGVLEIKVESGYEDIVNTIEVESENQLKEDVVEIKELVK